ncbi:MAG: hypothetical protein EOO01_11770 [Chitinophagaceae bacterium]|nr:MAG: hypothetical protein EOO01_11770 [Chitinophagaceae bacterium]
MGKTFFLFLLSYAVNLYSQPSIAWEKTLPDESPYNPVKCMIATQDGGCLILTVYGDLKKLSANGNLEWHKAFGDDAFHTKDIHQTADGGYFFIGTRRSVIDSNNNHDLVAASKAWTYNLDKTGSIKSWKPVGTVSWAKSIVRPLKDGSYLLLRNDDTLLVANNSNYKVAFGSLRKIDKAGNIIWSKTYLDESESYETLNLAMNPDGGAIIISRSLNIEKGVREKYIRRLFLITIDSLGNVVRKAKTAPIEPGNKVRHCIATSDGGFAAAGVVQNDAFIWKLNPDATFQWRKTWNDPNAAECTDIIETADHTLIAAGFQVAKLKPITLKAILFSYNLNGDLIWKCQFERKSTTQFLKIIEAVNGGLITGGMEFKLPTDHYGPVWITRFK